ncbi:MAG: sigma-70 family RNA polymerase sigma factor [Deltaproteobacteria bacterium]
MLKGRELSGIALKAQALKWPLPYLSRIMERKKALPPQAKHFYGDREEYGHEERAAYEPHGQSENREIKDGRLGASTDSVRLYFNNIKRFPLLKPEEEKTLARRIAKGDKSANKRMIESNLRLVVSIAKRYINRELPIQDLIEEGNVGLIKAVERFKAQKGCKFSTYATYWIKQSIERAIANQANTVRLPIHVTADMSRVSRASRHLSQQFNREPSLAEISDATGLSGRYVRRLDTISRKSYSLEATLPDGTELSLMDRLEDTAQQNPLDIIDNARMSGRVHTWLSSLDDNEKRILRMRFGFDDNGPQTLESIGRAFGVTRERVRQVEVKAIEKLKRLAEAFERQGTLSAGA